MDRLVDGKDRQNLMDGVLPDWVHGRMVERFLLLALVKLNSTFRDYDRYIVDG